MALEPIRPKDLPPAVTVYAADSIPTDDGVTVNRATPSQLVDAGAPVPSEAAAIAGIDNVSRMTPFLTRAVLNNETAPSVLLAQAWAESPTPPIPGSKSSKTWAGESAASAIEAALYDGPWLDTVSALIADTSLTYTPAQPSTVSAGDYVRTRSEGFAYQVAASGAVDQHVTTAGGVKLYVLPSAGVVNFLAFAPANGITNQSTLAQKAADQAKATGARLHFGGFAVPTIYALQSVDIAGLSVSADPNVTFRLPASTVGWTFQALGAEIAPITTPMRLENLVFAGIVGANGAIRLEWCHNLKINNIQYSGYDVASRSCTIVWLRECISPLVKRLSGTGGDIALVFESCTNPRARDCDIRDVGRDGIVFYTEPGGTTTNAAFSENNTVDGFSMAPEAGRAGIHFYGVRRAHSIGDTVRDDNSQTFDDTSAIRARDCEDFVFHGYNISNVRTGVLANHLNDYALPPHNITRTRGVVGVGTVSDYVKFGVCVAGPSGGAPLIICPIEGAVITNGANTVSGAGVSHAGIGKISAHISDTPQPGIRSPGRTNIAGSTFARCGSHATSIPAVYVDGIASIGENLFFDDRGTPTANLAIRVLPTGTAKINPNTFSTGISTAAMQLETGATILRGSRLNFGSNGVPTFTATIQNGSYCLNNNGQEFQLASGAWFLANGQFRSQVGSPVGALTPVMIGERFFDTANKNWWTATGATSADWVVINQIWRTPVTKTADFTVADSEKYLINNKAASTCTVTLPTASAANQGREINFTNWQAQAVVSVSANVVPRAGGAAATAILAATAGSWATLVSNGANWQIVAGS